MPLEQRQRSGQWKLPSASGQVNVQHVAGTGVACAPAGPALRQARERAHYNRIVAATELFSLSLRSAPGLRRVILPAC